MKAEIANNTIHQKLLNDILNILKERKETEITPKLWGTLFRPCSY